MTPAILYRTCDCCGARTKPSQCRPCAVCRRSVCPAYAGADNHCRRCREIEPPPVAIGTKR